MKVLITGCPRSGTRYMSWLLTAHGADVRHERVGADGTVDWHLAGIPWEGRVIHQVRNPRDCIASLQTIESWKWIERALPDFSMPDESIGLEARLEAMCQFYVRWNERAVRNAASRIRIEDVERGWSGLRFFFPKLSAFNPKLVARNVNARPHAPLSWAQILALPTGPEVAEQARVFGYKVTQ